MKTLLMTVVILVFVILSGCVDNRDAEREARNKAQEEECKEAASERGLAFQKYEPGVGGRAECWAYNATTGDSVQLW